ncbi:hypothetical protein CSB45_07185 [candidate division KSB3 bacterium]|uniref:Ferrous iron transporter FeoA-like domain-containing protein n=1 Tax=candidate division KSB3 bacterium TaxID=2044937 RepID=A0A2G6E755_9BACT|nr:MAG: hypothetical protein CSB45_07185 [candidate division KSB3 bacterium]PIE29987.1 MAG: hypothetical protein CSA57_05410 [candidate division KSB3 bacterium]
MEMDTGQFCTLQDLKVRQKGRVIALTGEHESCARIESMGIHVGCNLEVIHAGDRANPALVAVGDARLAIGHDLLDNILIAIET